MLEEGVPDLLVVGTAADVEEVDGDVLVADADLLDAVVDADGGDVLVDELALAVPFYDAGLARLGVPDRDQLRKLAGTFSSIWLPYILSYNLYNSSNHAQL